MNIEELATQMIEFSKSIAKSRDAKDEMGALVLFYAYCDGIASLLRLKEEKRTNAKYFMRFLREYVLAGTDLQPNEDDLWSARCGMLHTFSPYSDMTEGPTPRARKVVYVGSSSQAKHCEDVMAWAKNKDHVFVDPYDLFNAFVDGVVRFVKAVRDDEDLADRVLFHADRFFGAFRIKIPQQGEGGNSE